MKTLFGNDEAATLHAAIRKLFTELGGNSPARAVAEKAIERGIIPDWKLKALTLRGATELVRDALKELTPDRVPFAAPLSTGPNAPWKQTEIFSYEEAAEVFCHRMGGITSDLKSQQHWVEWMLHKFHQAPPMPRLVYDEAPITAGIVSSEQACGAEGLAMLQETEVRARPRRSAH